MNAFIMIVLIIRSNRIYVYFMKNFKILKDIWLVMLSIKNRVKTLYYREGAHKNDFRKYDREWLYQQIIYFLCSRRHLQKPYFNIRYCCRKFGFPITRYFNSFWTQGTFIIYKIWKIHDFKMFYEDNSVYEKGLEKII